MSLVDDGLVGAVFVQKMMRARCVIVYMHAFLGDLYRGVSPHHFHFGGAA